MRAEKSWSNNTVSSLNGPVCECTQTFMLVMNLNYPNFSHSIR